MHVRLESDWFLIALLISFPSAECVVHKVFQCADVFEGSLTNLRTITIGFNDIEVVLVFLMFFPDERRVVPSLYLYYTLINIHFQAFHNTISQI